MTSMKVNYQYELILLLLGKQKHQRELAKELRTSLTRVQSILSELRSLNVMDFREEGKNHMYFLKRNLVSKSLVLCAENYKLVKLLRSYPYLEHLFRQILDKVPEKMILLFGSYAKFTPKGDSDIDIYIETINSQTKEKVENLYDRLSVKIGKFNPDDLLVREIIKNHVIIKGSEHYYEKINFLD